MEIHLTKRKFSQYTPKAPRGEKALQSLNLSLQALNASIPSSLLIHHNEVELDKDRLNQESELFTLLEEGFGLLR